MKISQNIRIYTWPEWEIVRALSAKWPLRGADLWHLAAAGEALL